MDTKKFDDIFQKTIQSKGIHEAVVMIENTSGSFQYNNSYGGKDANSPMVIASITKLFTTACILILHEEKKISLTDKIEHFFEPGVLNGLHNYKGQDFVNELTVMHLLCQTSGVPDAYEETKNCLKKQMLSHDIGFSFSDLLEHTKSLKPHFTPQFNQKAYYADINFDLLGKIIEKVTDSPLDQAFYGLICKPLGLLHTYLPTSEKDLIPHIFYKDTKLYRPRFLMSCGASGGVISTAKELMTFIKAFFHGTLFDTHILDEFAKYRKLQLQMTPIHYGLGHMQISLGGFSTMLQGKGQLVGHSGSTGSFAFYNPANNLFYVGDVNQISNPVLPIRLLMRLSMSVK